MIIDAFEDWKFKDSSKFELDSNHWPLVLYAEALTTTKKLTEILLIKQLFLGNKSDNGWYNTGIITYSY